MTTERCPCCQQPLPGAPVKGPRRKCYDCGKPMGQHHKYTYQEREGILTVVHRVCAHPRMSVLPSEYRRAHGDDIADRMGIPAHD
jgi:hypothetical protein